MKFFSVVTVFVLGLLALANAAPLSPDHDVYCINCNVDNRKTFHIHVHRDYDDSYECY